MTTVVDALVMTLGLDTKAFDKGQRQATEGMTKFKKQADDVAKNVADGGKRMADGFMAVRRELLGVLAVFGVSTGIKDFIQSNVEGQAALGRLSTNLQLSGKRLEAWGQTAKEMGGQASDAFNALQAVAGGLAEASIKGRSAFTDAASMNGISLEGVKNAEDGLLRISHRLHQLPAQQAMWLANQLGVGSMFNELYQVPEAELQKRLAAAEARSRATPESIAAAQRLQAQWADIKQRFTEISESAFIKIWPTLERLAEKFAAWMDRIDWDKVVSRIAGIARNVNNVVEAFGGWKVVAIALGGVLALKVLAPVISLTAGLIRLAPLIASSTAGLWGLAAAAGALVGTGIGTLIYKGTLEGNSAGNWLGRGFAQIMASMGSSDAQAAVIRDNWSKLSADERKQRIAAYQGLSPGARSAYEQASPVLADIMHAAISGQKRSGLARGLRNNNPGNLNFAGQAGAHLEGGPGARFAAFDSMQDGIAALVTQLARYVVAGNDTIAGIVKKYAPAADGNNVAAYIADLTKSTGKGANDKLDLSDMNTLIPLVQAIIRHEGNGNFSREDIMGGIRVGAAHRLAARGGSATTSTSTAETHIGKIEVHTAATDAKGIVRDMRRAMMNNALVATADTGLD